jgi:hypothetical protein
MTSELERLEDPPGLLPKNRLFEKLSYPAGFTAVTDPAPVPNATIFDAGLLDRAPAPNPICPNAELKTADTLLKDVIPVIP